MSELDYDDIFTPRDIITKFNEECGEKYGTIRYGQFYKWATHGKNGFPNPIRTLAKYRLYSYNEVKEWIILWRKINNSLGNKEWKDGQRKNS